MPPTLGKRKRVTRSELEQPSRSASPSSDSQESDGEDLQAIFRRAFEAKFKPIEIEPVNKKPRQVAVEEEDEEEEEDWSGISSEDEDGVEVVEHTDIQRGEEDRASKAEMRKFMARKPVLPPTYAILTRSCSPRNHPHPRPHSPPLMPNPRRPPNQQTTPSKSLTLKMTSNSNPSSANPHSSPNTPPLTPLAPPPHPYPPATNSQTYTSNPLARNPLSSHRSRCRCRIARALWRRGREGRERDAPRRRRMGLCWRGRRRTGSLLWGRGRGGLVGRVWANLRVGL